MSIRLAAILAASSTVLLASLPAWAQTTPDFGTDSSPYANDGECDDPRFTGAGVASMTVESDRMADATDCRAAFEAGTAQLAEGQSATAAPATPAAPPSKGAPAPAAQPAQPAAPAAPATTPSFNFGDDSGQYPNDGECDDRRFTGAGMATSGLSIGNTGRDAPDCQALHEAGRIRFWNPLEAQAATQCASIDFGADTSQYANDGECDDIRFEGLSTAVGLSSENMGADATDCRQLCDRGAVSLRDY